MLVAGCDVGSLTAKAGRQPSSMKEGLKREFQEPNGGVAGI